MTPELKPGAVYALFMKGDHWLSKWIMWRGYADYSHVELVRDGVAIGARGDGVKERMLDDALEGYGKVRFLRVDCSQEQADAIWAKAESQVGKKYDFFGLVGILFHSRRWQEDDSWWCSELVAWACRGVFDLVRVNELYWITPEDLHKSMRLADDDGS